MIYRKQSGYNQFEEDVFSKIAQSIARITHEVKFLVKFSQTKPEVKSMNFTYYDLYYTATKNRDEKQKEELDKEKNENEE